MSEPNKGLPCIGVPVCGVCWMPAHVACPVLEARLRSLHPSNQPVRLSLVPDIGVDYAVNEGTVTVRNGVTYIMDAEGVWHLGQLDGPPANPDHVP